MRCSDLLTSHGGACSCCGASGTSHHGQNYVFSKRGQRRRAEQWCKVEGSDSDREGHRKGEGAKYTYSTSGIVDEQR